jgi:hypothetical protein
MHATDLAPLLEQILRAKPAEHLWRLMLQEDPVYAKIPDPLRDEAVVRAAAIGREAARGLPERVGTRDPKTIAETLGVPIVLSPDPHVFGTVVRTSTYTQRTRTITLYLGAVDEMDRLLAGGLGDLLGVASVGPVYLAHELFHHLEEDSLGRAAERLKVITFKLGPIVLRSGIGQMSEIAADAFAQALLGLRFAPRLLDFLTIWIHNPEAARLRLSALAGV